VTDRAVFLDRDGTLIEEVGYLDRLDRMTLFPWSIDAVRLLNRAGFRVVVVTNQAGVARGLFPESFVGEAHAVMRARFAEGGATIERFYYCPHHPEATVAAYREECACRKPRPGMIWQAERELRIDPAKSFVVGDRWIDVAMGRAAGARAVLVRTGYGRAEEPLRPAALEADFVADTLMDATGWILREERRV